MWFSFVVLILIVVVTVIVLIMSWKNFNEVDRTFALVVGLGVLSLTFAVIFCLSSVSVPTGYAVVEKDFGGRYTGVIFDKPGFYTFKSSPSHSTQSVDIRNNKEAVSVNVMKDKTYNVSASIEVVYDLDSNKLVDILSNYSDYKNTVIGATVKDVVTSNNTLANSQSLTKEDEKQIESRLAKYGVKVTNIYMNSYKLTNSNNFALNTGSNNN